MVSAWLLSRSHEVTLFEANSYVGGHTNTVEVAENGHRRPIDTGFIVFNERNYPNFVRLLGALGVESRPTRMSFSVRCETSGLEYNSQSLNRLFAQRRNALRPRFWKMLAEVLRFNREATALLRSPDSATLEQFSRSRGFSDTFLRFYLIPIAASIWSARPASIPQFPVHFLARFLHNHGLLQVRNQPVWRVIRGGSREYVKRIVQPFRERIRLRSPVQSLRRQSGAVEVRTRRGGWERFDHAVLALHSDQALAVLEEPTPAERSVLGAIPYQPNPALLHTDRRLLPRRRRAWASWNYHLPERRQEEVAITYHSNTLQRFRSPIDYCVTLNRAAEVRPDSVIERFDYSHPAYSPQAVQARARHREISGPGRVHYCGAYWGYGFHEDGVNSALRVCAQLGERL